MAVDGAGPAPGGPRPASPLVLVVDDDESIRQVAAAALELVGGYRVLLASCGAEALSAAAEHQPDLVLMDVMMPGTDGPATGRALAEQESTATIPVVFLTAKADQLPGVQGGNVRGLIVKPFDPMQLTEQVESLLGWGS